MVERFNSLIVFAIHICAIIPTSSYLASVVCIGLAHQRSPKVKTKPAILLIMLMAINN